MDTDMLIRGALSSLPEIISEAALLREFESRGLTAADARLTLERTVRDGYVQRSAEGTFTKLAHRLSGDVPGQLADVRSIDDALPVPGNADRAGTT